MRRMVTLLAVAALLTASLTIQALAQTCDVRVEGDNVSYEEKFVDCPAYGPPGPECQYHKIAQLEVACRVAIGTEQGQVGCTIRTVPKENYQTTCELLRTAVQWNGVYVNAYWCWWGTDAEFSGTSCTSIPPCADVNANGICDKDEQPACWDTDGDGICDKDEQEPSEDECGECGSPLLVNLSQGPWRFAGAVPFDLSGSGQKHLWAWPEGELAFLAVDYNSNGSIDDGRELFGDALDANGFERLRDFDSNRDGIVNAVDPIWPLLKLWRDGNRDGLTQPEELILVAGTDIVGFGLDYHATARADRRNGAYLKLQGTVYYDGGRREPYYDVYFRLISESAGTNQP